MVKNQAEESEFEQLMAQELEKFDKHLKFRVESALTYQCTESTADEWVD